jgi:hypothetical protein
MYKIFTIVLLMGCSIVSNKCSAQLFNQLQLKLNGGSTLDNNDNFSHQNLYLLSATTNLSKRLYCGINAGVGNSRQGNNVVRGLKLYGFNFNYHYAVSPRSRLEFNNSIQYNTYRHERSTDLLIEESSAFAFIQPALAVQPFNHYGRLTLSVGINFGVPVWPQANKTAWLNYGTLGVGFLLGDNEEEDD